jgi:uncharacterized protein YcaQ
VNYGFVTGAVQALMHPRSNSGVPAEGCGPWPAARTRRANLLLEFVRERGAVHPREVDHHFAHGAVQNYWGGSSNATTHLLDAMHYRGLLRVARRDRGVRVYTACEHPPGPEDADTRRARIDLLADTAVRIYAPLPGPSLAFLLRRLRYAVPQWSGELTEAQRRARQRLGHTNVDGVEWYWPSGDDPARAAVPDEVRLLAPFDPVVWDRGRFERLWGWQYRFEAYTPAPKRQRGYYALPLLWRDRVIGWGNLSVEGEELKAEFGYTGSPPRDRAFQRELRAELDRLREFLKLAGSVHG